MAVLRVAICDDKARALKRTTSLVAKCPGVAIAGAFSSGRTFLDAIEGCQPDVALIDVEMPDPAGFDIVAALADQDWTVYAEPPLVIFTTDDPNFGIAAFDCGAVGFLNKPIELKPLQQCLERARVAMTRHEPRQRLHHLRAELDLVRNLYRRVLASRYLIVRNWGRPLTRVSVSSIEWIEAKYSSNVLLHCGPLVYRKVATLKGMTDQLAGAGFMRIHLCILVNTRAIVHVESGYGVTAVRVRSGDRLPVSRPYRTAAQALKQRF